MPTGLFTLGIGQCLTQLCSLLLATLVFIDLSKHHRPCLLNMLYPLLLSQQGLLCGCAVCGAVTGLLLLMCCRLLLNPFPLMLRLFVLV